MRELYSTGLDATNATLPSHLMMYNTAPLFEESLIDGIDRASSQCRNSAAATHLDCSLAQEGKSLAAVSIRPKKKHTANNSSEIMALARPVAEGLTVYQAELIRDDRQSTEREVWSMH